MAGPWEKFKSDEAGPWTRFQSEEPSELESAARGSLQTLSAGFEDEIRGYLLSKWYGTPYEKERDDIRGLNKKAQETNPKSYLGGEVLGGVVGLGKLNLGLKGAAMAGAAYGLGGSEAKDLKGMAKDTAIGGALGGAGFAAADKVVLPAAKHLGKKVAPAFDGLTKYLASKSDDAADAATIAHLRPTPKVKMDLGKDGLKDIAREVRGSGAIKRFAKADETAARLENLVDEVGAVKGDIVNASKAEIDPIGVYDRIHKEVIDPLRGNSENLDIIAMLEKKADSFLQTHAPGFTPGGRAPGTPTTLTRKMEFSPKKSEIPFEDGRMILEESDTSVAGLIGPRSSSKQIYSTPKVADPFATDPNTGLPIKLLSEKRLDGVPETKPIFPRTTEAEKTSAMNKINYADDSHRVGAQKSYADLLKRLGDENIADPAFPDSKRAYGNLLDAAGMANRTGSLTDGGLMPHITDVGANSVVLGELLKGNPAGLPLSGIRAFTKGRVASTAATGFDSLSKGLNKAKLPTIGQGPENVLKGGFISQGAIAKPFESVPRAAGSPEEADIARKPQAEDGSAQRVDRVLGRVRGSQYEGILNRAKADGTFNTKYYILLNQEPEFRKLLEDDEKLK